jgi:inner membrane protein
VDPLTQTLLGATAGRACLGRAGGRAALLAGAMGGALPDIDVLWASLADPDVPWAAHRHFTHALLLIPVGALLAAAPLLAFRSLREQWRTVLAAAAIGTATHGPLDACTAYGTFLYWPFTDTRVAWDIISIIDPVFTLVLLVAVIAALFSAQARPVRIGGALALAYLGLGIVQHERARTVQLAIAEHRGQHLERGRVMPTIGNLVLWRSIYETRGRLFADAVRLSPAGSTLIRPGSSLPRFTADDLPDRSADPERLDRVFATFENFADGYVAVALEQTPQRTLLGDMRYSLDPAVFVPLWGLCVQPDDAIVPAVWIQFTQRGRPWLRDLGQALVEPGPAFVGVDDLPARGAPD